MSNIQNVGNVDFNKAIVSSEIKSNFKDTSVKDTSLFEEKTSYVPNVGIGILYENFVKEDLQMTGLDNKYADEIPGYVKNVGVDILPQNFVKEDLQ